MKKVKEWRIKEGQDHHTIIQESGPDPMHIFDISLGL